MRRMHRQLEAEFDSAEGATHVQICDHAGCRAEGLYRAPKARDRLNEPGQRGARFLRDELRHTLSGGAKGTAQARNAGRQALLRPIGNVIPWRRLPGLPAPVARV